MHHNLPYEARRIQVDSHNRAWVVLEDDTFWYFDVSLFEWVQFGGGHVYDAVGGASGLPWIIEKSPDEGNVYRDSGDRWEDMQRNLRGQARRIYIDVGVPWVVLEDGTFYNYLSTE